jgi:hypothetical protein
MEVAFPFVIPERTRIYCHAAFDKTACAPFRKERRTKLLEPPSSTGNPGQPRDLQFCGPLLEMFFDRANPDFLPRFWQSACLSSCAIDPLGASCTVMELPHFAFGRRLFVCPGSSTVPGFPGFRGGRDQK